MLVVFKHVWFVVRIKEKSNMVKALLMMLALGAVCGLILGFASKAFYVEPDHRAEDLLALLPGYNCGSCGYSGCGGMAEAIVSGELDMITCNPIKQEDRAKIVEYLANTPGPDGEVIKIKQ